ncbi:hypothetical protein [Mesorhizobium sp. AR07]|uniref:hypothetical protein n=1 Tax=Mesorhizobium sp. AR07 TaxID=2865838 RepID=UPI00215F2887|nr:hypothetical protein [Mesorhizobium sp. AR07]
MVGDIDLVNIGAASERFFRLYYTHCISPDRDTLFSLLEAGHSLNDRLKVSADLDFFDVPEFTALKCLRNYFHHEQELRHLVRLIPIGGYPIMTDLMTLCLVTRDLVEAAIEETTARYREDTRQACHGVFHWYGPVVNINPALFNFVVAAYERLKNQGVPLAGEAVEEFEVSYHREEENNLPHIVDGRLATSAGSINDVLTDIMDTTSF